MPRSFDGQVALITGGSSGIGVLQHKPSAPKVPKSSSQVDASNNRQRR